MASPDVLLGAGLYETVRVSDGRALHGERHLERMTASAHALGLPAPERAAFAEAIARAEGAGDGRARAAARARRRGRARRRAPRGARAGARSG